jgi:hypothetical protein
MASRNLFMVLKGRGFSRAVYGLLGNLALATEGIRFEDQSEVPQRLKPGSIARVTARLKARPFKTLSS